MSDELERQLDEFYRKLDGSARRVEARWKSTPAAGESRIAAWMGAGVAAAAAILLVLSALRSEPKVPGDAVVLVPPAPVVEPAPTPTPAPAPAPRPFRPAPPEEPRREPPAPRPSEPTRTPPAPAEPRPAEPRPAEPAPTPPPPTPPSTKVVRAKAVLRETEGSFDLADRGVRGKQTRLKVFAGDRLRASSLVKVTLADDRVVLLSPRTLVEFRPEEKRLTLAMEQGELLADLIGPGPEIRVVTKTCEITPLGTVFGVKADAGKVLVVVEKGRVDVQTPKGRATLRPAEAIQAADDGALHPAEFRPMPWARSQRAPELALYADDFSRPGAWTGEVANGAVRAVARPGSGPLIQVVNDKGLFETPIRGSLSIVCRADRAGKFKVQLYSPEQKTTYTKQNINILRGEAWRTVVVDFDELVPSDKSRPARLPAGSLVTDLLFMYGDEGERGNFWIDSLKVTELRP